MGDGPEVPDDWDPAGPVDPSAALLRRAISHVESLLQRLERPGGDGPPLESAVQPADLAAPPPIELASVESIAPSAPIESTGSRAEALTITLRAREEANRMRADAAAEGERILIEAREMSERLDAETRDAAVELMSAARHDADALTTAARAEAAESVRVMLAEAVREADRIRELAYAQADLGATRLADADVARAAADATRAQTLELLGVVHECVDQVRTAMRDVMGDLGASLATVDASAASIEMLLIAPSATAAGAKSSVEPSAAETPAAPSDSPAPSADSLMDILNEPADSLGTPRHQGETRPAFRTLAQPGAFLPRREQHERRATWAATDGRRPLGLLFGAPRT